MDTGKREEGAQIPVWTWRDAVRKASVPPLTKLVCYSIATYLNDVGSGCFPSIRSLIRDSGLSNRSVATHIQNAVDAGLLVVERKVGKDGRRQLTHYLPRFPANAVLPRFPAVAMQDEHDDGSDDETPETHVNEAHVGQNEVNEAHAARPSEGGSHGPRELHRVNLVQREVSIEGNIQVPPNPRAAGGQKGLDEDLKGKAAPLLAALKADGVALGVVEHLLRPVLEARRFSAADRLGELRRLRDAAKALPGPALAKAAENILAASNVAVKPERIAAAIDLAKRAGAQVGIRRGTAQWQRWAEHFAANDPRQAKAMDKFDYWQVPSDWPSGVGATERQGDAA